VKVEGIKKTAVVLLTFFYSFCAVGLGVNVHYCHGKIASVSIGFSKDDCCCQKESKRKCCSDKAVVLKIESKQIKTTTYSWVSGYQNVILRCFTPHVTPCNALSYFQPEYRLLSTFPPPNPVYLTNRNIRI